VKMIDASDSQTAADNIVKRRREIELECNTLRDKRLRLFGEYERVCNRLNELELEIRYIWTKKGEKCGASSDPVRAAEAGGDL
jgi:predicted nuclease with TOPRIM domain